MIKVSVHSTEIRNLSGVSKTTQRPYNMNFQDVYMHTVGKDGKPAPYPQKVELILDTDHDGAPLFYPVGDYTFAPSSVYVDKNGKPAFSPRLVPLKPAQAVARAA